MQPIRQALRRVFTGRGVSPCPVSHGLAHTVAGERVRAAVIEDRDSPSQRALEITWQGGCSMRIASHGQRSTGISAACSRERDGQSTIEVTVADGMLGYPSAQDLAADDGRPGFALAMDDRQKAEHECLIASVAVDVEDVSVKVGLYELAFTRAPLFKVQSGCGREVVISACRDGWDGVYVRLIGSQARVYVPRSIFCDPNRIRRSPVRSAWHGTNRPRREVSRVIQGQHEDPLRGRAAVGQLSREPAVWR